jgi:hypothetical protein
MASILKEPSEEEEEAAEADDARKLIEGLKRLSGAGAGPFINDVGGAEGALIALSRKCSCCIPGCSETCTLCAQLNALLSELSDLIGVWRLGSFSMNKSLSLSNTEEAVR